MNIARRILKAYLHLVSLIFLIVAGVLTALTLYELVVYSLNDGTFSVETLYVRIKLLVALSAIIPLVIMSVFGVILGIFTVFEIEVKKGEKNKDG